MKIFQYVDQWLRQPKLIMGFCLVLILFNIVFDGTLFQIRKLYLQQKSLDQQTLEIQTKNKILIEKMEKLSDPKHLEKEVRNRFDLANQGDLIFIFPEDE